MAANAPKGTICYQMLMHRGELQNRRRKTVELKKSKIELTFGLIIDCVNNVDKCTWEDMLAFSREVEFKKDLEKQLIMLGKNMDVAKEQSITAQSRGIYPDEDMRIFALKTMQKCKKQQTNISQKTKETLTKGDSENVTVNEKQKFETNNCDKVPQEQTLTTDQEQERAKQQREKTERTNSKHGKTLSEPKLLSKRKSETKNKNYKQQRRKSPKKDIIAQGAEQQNDQQTIEQGTDMQRNTKLKRDVTAKLSNDLKLYSVLQQNQAPYSDVLLNQGHHNSLQQSRAKEATIKEKLQTTTTQNAPHLQELQNHIEIDWNKLKNFLGNNKQTEATGVNPSSSPTEQPETVPSRPIPIAQQSTVGATRQITPTTQDHLQFAFQESAKLTSLTSTVDSLDKAQQHTPSRTVLLSGANLAQNSPGVVQHRVSSALKAEWYNTQQQQSNTLPVPPFQCQLNMRPNKRQPPHGGPQPAQWTGQHTICSWNPQQKPNPIMQRQWNMPMNAPHDSFGIYAMQGRSPQQQNQQKQQQQTQWHGQRNPNMKERNKSPRALQQPWDLKRHERRGSSENGLQSQNVFAADNVPQQQPFGVRHQPSTVNGYYQQPQRNEQWGLNGPDHGTWPVNRLFGPNEPFSGKRNGDWNAQQTMDSKRQRNGEWNGEGHLRKICTV